MEVGLAVGGAVLSSALNVFFDRMTPKFPSLFQGRNGADQLFKRLKRSLRVIEAVLDDAEDKRTTNMHVDEWVNDVKDTVYDAEDLVDEINTEALRLVVKCGEQSVTSKVSHLSIGFLNKIIPEIEEVVTSLENFGSQINMLGLNVIKREYSYGPESTSSVDELDVYGRDNEKEKLIHMVFSENCNGNDLSVIPIVGMGGLGKTTLAQFVFGDERVQKHFDTKAWVSVSGKFDPLEITTALVRKITDSSAPGEKDDLDMLQGKLKKSLTGKKFFIVLDNIWNVNYIEWDKLRVPLKYGRKGSVIFVTTRDENVADMMKTQEMCRIDTLSYTDSWSLFKKHAFNNPIAFPELEKIGKEIVKKCKGLPLAIKTLAGLLRSKTEVKEWDDIFRSKFWTLENKPNDVLPVLKLSYHHLPPHLKHCFAFCAVFPKNYSFDEEELVLLWMANDLFQQSNRNDESLEDKGHTYFRQLRSMSFFQKKDDGRYLMHDLINDLAQYVCGKVCVRFEDYQHGEIPSEARHFSYVSEYLNASEKFKVLAQVKGLRTFFPINSKLYDPIHAGFRKLTKLFLSNILVRLGRLRVLSFCGYDIEELPSSLCKLEHLRYLNLSWTCIKRLPNGICRLYNLQTLLLSHCAYLVELPIDLTNLVNLHHLDLRGTEKLKEMPSHISRLKSLQTLSCFIVDKSPGRRIEELGNLHLRGYLKIIGLQNVESLEDALKAYLRDKNQLEELVLQWSGSTGGSQIAEDILGGLRPNSSLKRLTIEGYDGTRFPNWQPDSSLCNIVSLYLTNCINCFRLPTLGHLSSLKSLTIKGLNSIAEIGGEEFYGSGSSSKPFESLVTLRIEQMSDLKEWDTSGNVDFSRLEKLYIIDCPKLVRALPSRLLCLKEFEVSKCPRLVFPVDLFSQMSSLEILTITNMPNLEKLSNGLVSFPKVKRIVLKDCPSLVSLPHVGQSANIKDLKIENCTKLEFPKGEASEGNFNSLKWLWLGSAGDSFDGIPLGLFPNLLQLKISDCESLKVFSAPHGTQNHTLLRCLDIYRCKKLKSLPEQMRSLLPFLTFLGIRYCPEIECFPEGGLPSSVEEMGIESCEKLMRCRRDWGLQRLPALRGFLIGGDDYEELFPEEGLLPCSLQILYIWRCENLKTVNQRGSYSPHLS